MIQKQISKLHRKLDGLIQQNRPPSLCEACGLNAEVYHHYIQKRQSTYLRYHAKNLIQLCNSCHYKHHKKSDPAITSAINIKRGAKWIKWIDDHRNIIVKRDKLYLEKLKKLEEKLGETYKFFY